jgi:Protein of unknown function (DUF2786)
MADQDTTMERVRKLLAQAEDPSTTPAEAEAFTVKAAGLMAKYGIDRARLGAIRPETDQPTSKKIDVPNPWADVRVMLLTGIARAMRCELVLLTAETGKRVHMFGYASDLERVDVLYTSLLLQMANGLAATPVPVGVRSARAWRRSWQLGFAGAVGSRVRTAEAQAAASSDADRAATGGSGPSTAVVLADRSLAVKQQLKQEYPRIRSTRMTCSGSGYGSGYAAGQRANLGGSAVGGGSRRALA